MFGTIRVAATYRLLGDESGEDWFNTVFSQHQEADNVKGYQLQGVLTGAFGLQYVAFTVDLEVVVREREDSELMEAAREILNSLIGDSDVVVYGVERLEIPDL